MHPLKIAAAVLCWLLIILAILFTVLDIQLSPESGAQQRFLRFYSEYGTEERFGIEPKQCAAALMAMIHAGASGLHTDNRWRIRLDSGDVQPAGDRPHG